MTFEHYQRYQRLYEVIAVTLIFTINAGILSTSIVMENSRHGQTPSFQLWEPFLWEFSSALLIIAQLPAIQWFMNWRPLGWTQPKSRIIEYLLASLIFSIVHVVGMVIIRKLVYLAMDSHYQFGNVLYEFIYEYRKDLWSFLFLVTALRTYQFVIERLNGEAHLINEGEKEDSDAAEQLSDRLLVKKLGKEFVIKLDSVEWLEAAGNYVNLHIGKRAYPIRSTMANLMTSIQDRGFCRIHRSFSVNLEAVRSIQALDNGDNEVTLNSGKQLRLSRRYRDQFKSQLANL